MPSSHPLLLARDGREYGIEESVSPIRNALGEVFGTVLVFRDVSLRRRLAREMTHRATHDGLTGLTNRAEFESRLASIRREAGETGAAHALLFIDLDHFKLVNDTCGHASGDLLLKQISAILTDSVRSGDVIGRLGGDEFAILLVGCGLAHAEEIAQTICDRMSAYRFVQEDRRFRIGASIGLVPLDGRWDSAAAVMQAADSSCYVAKESGRNRVHVWSDDDVTMHARQSELMWRARIERAIDEDGFALFAQRVQPMMEASAGWRIEVLLRMKNDDGTLSPPSAFLPAADRFDLITRIDHWVLDHTIAWVTAIPDLSVCTEVSINLSGRSVGDRIFHEWAIGLVRGCTADLRSRLCLEISETSAMTNLTDATDFIRQVRALDVKVALDDFGAGASSFGYLKRLPVDYLKIDGQFVRNLTTGPLDDVAVRSFVDIARVVGVRTIAESVDSAEVLDRLRRMGVDFAQGYYLHEPEPLEQTFSLASVSGLVVEQPIR